MAGRNKFSSLVENWQPERKDRLERRVEATLAAMELEDLVRDRGFTQEQLAERLGKAQSNVSRSLHRTDMKVGTLQELVEAMGGELEVVAHFPDRDVRITQFEK